jgi:hypothetical protein
VFIWPTAVKTQHADIYRICCYCLLLPAAASGLVSRVPTAHSILLSAVVGPLGLLCHQLTKVNYTYHLNTIYCCHFMQQGEWSLVIQLLINSQLAALPPRCSAQCRF